MGWRLNESAMKTKNRELLNRAAGVLEGLAVNADMTSVLAEMLMNAVEWIDIALNDEEAPK